MRRFFLIGFVSACVFVFGGCAEAPKLQSTYWPTEGWRTSTPEQQGLDSQGFVDALDTIQARSLPIHSLLVIRHGYLVLEAYFYPYSGKTLHSWASVTKSITTTLIGLAVDDKSISTQQRIIDFYPEYRQILTGAKGQMTVEDLLTMTTGLECGYKPGEVEALSMQRSSNFIKAVLELPMHTEPGGAFSYCSGGMHVLSSIVTRATGKSALEFAQHRLFEPLGIKKVVWPADPQGVSFGWAGLRMQPRDMAKVGYLFLHQGTWDGQQIISSSWIRQATRRHVVVRHSKANYGYGWWIGTQELSGTYLAAGRGGQRVLVWPEKDLVVVTNGAGFDPGVLVPLLQPAFKSDQPLTENKTAYAQLQEKIALALKPPKPTPMRELPSLAHKVSAQTYVMQPNLLDIEQVSLTFDGVDEAGLEFQLGNKEIKAPVGLDGVYRFVRLSPEEPMLAVRGHWSNDNKFVLDYTEADGIQHYRVTSLFSDDKVTMTIDDLTGEIPTQTINGSAGGNATS